MSLMQQRRLTHETPYQREARLEQVSLAQQRRLTHETPDQREARLEQVSLAQQSAWYLPVLHPHSCHPVHCHSSLPSTCSTGWCSSSCSFAVHDIHAGPRFTGGSCRWHLHLRVWHPVLHLNPFGMYSCTLVIFLGIPHNVELAIQSFPAIFWHGWQVNIVLCGHIPH